MIQVGSFIQVVSTTYNMGQICQGYLKTIGAGICTLETPAGIKTFNLNEVALEKVVPEGPTPDRLHGTMPVPEGCLTKTKLEKVRKNPKGHFGGTKYRGYTVSGNQDGHWTTAHKEAHQETLSQTSHRRTGGGKGGGGKRAQDWAAMMAAVKAIWEAKAQETKAQEG